MRLKCPCCGEETAAPNEAATTTCEHCGEPFASSEAEEASPEELSTWILSGQEEQTEGETHEKDIHPSDLEQMETLFHDKYDVLELVGRGGMGAVYKARQKSPRRLVALKVLLGGYFASEPQRKRFKREAQAIALLKHPGIVRIYEFGEVAGQPYFTMDYVDGPNLMHYVRDNDLDKKAICRLLAEVAGAVYYAHRQGVIHADLKPGNVVVNDEGQPHVLDFGLARIARHSELSVSRITKTGTVTGTPEYMSPEQTLGEPAQIDERTDVYSLGVMLYELVTGHSPYRPDDESVFSTMRSIREEEPTPPTAFSPDVDRELQAILYTALEKDRDRRYQSAEAMKEDLERYVEGLPVNAVPPSLLYRSKKALRRNWKTWVPLGTGILLVAIAGVLFAVQAFAPQATVDNPAELLAAMDAPDKIRARVRRLMEEGDWMQAYMTAQFAAEVTPEELGLGDLPEQVAREAHAHTASSRQRVERLVAQEKWVEAFKEAMMAAKAAPKDSGGARLVRYVLDAARGKVRFADLRQRLGKLLQEGKLMEARPVAVFALSLAPEDAQVQRMQDMMRQALRRRLPQSGPWRGSGAGWGLGGGRGGGPGRRGRLPLRPDRPNPPDDGGKTNE